MKSHGIDLIGPIKIEILSTLPNWTSNDEGREIYVEDEEKRYYGNSTQWVDYVFEHSIASHNDTSVTGSQLDADHSKLSGIEESADVNNISDENATDLTDGGDTTLHDHAGIDENTAARHAESHSVASHNDTTATGAELETLTNNSIANTLHRHSELVASDGSPDPAFSINATGYATFPTGTGINEFSTDDTLGGNSDNAVPTEQAVKAYIDAVKVNIDKIWTYQNTAPTGWSIVTGTTDALLATKGGSEAYDTTGGTQDGTWTQPSHELSEAEMPEHHHEYNINTSQAGPGSGHGSPYFGLVGYQRDTLNAGSGEAHNHGTTYRPLANVGIVIERT